MQGHTVDDGGGSLRGFVFGFENEGTVAVLTASGLDLAARAEEPAAVVGRSEKGGETGARIEARDAHPINGAVARHEGGSIEIADEGVIFDGCGHG